MKNNRKSLLDLVEEPGATLTPQNILLHIWLKPRRVLKYLAGSPSINPLLWMYPALAGVSLALWILLRTNLGLGGYFIDPLVLVILSGFIFGLLWSRILLWVASAISMRIGAKNRAGNSYGLVCLAFVPASITVFFWLTRLLIFGRYFFDADFEINSSALSALMIIFDILAIALVSYSAILMIWAFGIMFGITYRSAFLILVLSMVLCSFPLFLLISNQL